MALSIGSIAFSGIQAGAKRLEVSADNVSRRSVENSEKNRVVQSDQAGGGVTTQVQTVPMPDELKTNGDNAFYSSSNIDYAEEGVEQKMASMATAASIAVYQKAADIEEEVLKLADRV